MTLLEDIFEAEDGLPPDIEPDDLPQEWFSPLTLPGSPPQLHPTLIRKLIVHITKVARPSKRHRINSRDANGATQIPRYKGRMAEIDTPTLSRILKMLERSVRAGEDLDPFRGLAIPQKAAKAKKAANGKKAQADSSRSKSQSPGEAVEDEPMQLDEPSGETQPITEQDIEGLTRTLELARDSILAADCCIALLASDRLPKQVRQSRVGPRVSTNHYIPQLYSEELITASLATVKNHLTKILYPFVEASLADTQLNPLLREVIQQVASPGCILRFLLSEIFQAVSSILPRINDLICADSMAMSEGIIIQAVYIAIGPFFVVESEGEGKGKKATAASNVIAMLGGSAMRGLRLDALSLIRSVSFKLLWCPIDGTTTNASTQCDRSSRTTRTSGPGSSKRSFRLLSNSRIQSNEQGSSGAWFLGVVSAAIDTYNLRLRDGRSIRTVSALLMQLVQTSAHDVRVEAKAIRKARDQAVALKRQESFNGEPQKESWLDEHDNEEIRLYASGLDSATKAAKTIIIFLTQRYDPFALVVVDV